jgi:hypothetical protein
VSRPTTASAWDALAQRAKDVIWSADQDSRHGYRLAQRASEAAHVVWSLARGARDGDSDGPSPDEVTAMDGAAEDYQEWRRETRGAPEGSRYRREDDA